MRGVTYALRKARQLNMPLVINLSFGNSYGSHDGSSLLERFLDNASEIGRTVICVGSGNEGAARGHFAGNITRDGRVELAVGNYERNLNIQLWKNYSDVFRIRLQAREVRKQNCPQISREENTRWNWNRLEYWFIWESLCPMRWHRKSIWT